MRKLRTLDHYEEDYLKTHPREVNEYVNILFEEYEEDGDIATLLSSLRVVCRVKGIAATAQASGLSRKGVQKALSEGGHPKFESIVAIMKAMGYCLMPKSIQSVEIRDK